MSLPSHWQNTTVGAVLVAMQSGFAQRPGEDVVGAVPQLRTHNVTPDGDISLAGLKYVSAGGKDLSRYYLQRGDVLFNNTNSEEWVGKTGVFASDGEFVFSNHITRLRPNTGIVLPEYLAAYLHLLWATGYSKARAKRWVSQAGIENRVLSGFTLPLPPIDEQRHIVEILDVSKALTRKKQRAIQLRNELASSLFEKHFGVVGQSSRWPMEAFGTLTRSSKYGPRFPDQQYGSSGAHVLRTTDINGDGTVRWWESPQLQLSDKQLAEHALQPGTLLVSRSGTIGPYALYDGDAGVSVAGAYLIEFRLSDEVNPEYVRSLFGTPYVQTMLKKAVRSAAQPNVNAPSIMRIPMPVPPRPRQDAFAREVTALRDWGKSLDTTMDRINHLSRSTFANALSGALTSAWRGGKRAAPVAAVVGARSAILKKGVATKRALRSDVSPTLKARPWLSSQLSHFQSTVLRALESHCAEIGQPVIAEDADEFARFYECRVLVEELQCDVTSIGNKVRRTLGQLAALGLIAKITLPKQNLETGQREYIKAFRPLRRTDISRARDLSLLDELAPEHILGSSFLVRIDRLSSITGDTDGMFRVLSIKKPDGHDLTHLIDAFAKYSSLEDLREELAELLGLPIAKVEIEEV